MQKELPKKFVLVFSNHAAALRNARQQQLSRSLEPKISFFTLIGQTQTSPANHKPVCRTMLQRSLAICDWNMKTNWINWKYFLKGNVEMYLEFVVFLKNQDWQQKQKGRERKGALALKDNHTRVRWQGIEPQILRRHFTNFS